MLFFVPIASGPAADGHSYGPFDFFFNLRSRYEVRSDASFDKSLDQEDTTFMNRLRAGFNYDTGQKGTSLNVTYQFTTTNFDDGNSSSDVTSKDLIEANIEHSWDGGFTRLGRQAVSVGSGRLVGTNNWGEVGRYWNGARFNDGKWDFFVGRLDVDRWGG